jgi:hypothetical protein
MLFSQRGFIEPDATFAQYGFVTKDGKHYIEVLVSKYGDKVPSRTMFWSNMATWDTIKKAQEFKEKYNKDGDWVLVKVEGLLLNFMEKDTND